MARTKKRRKSFIKWIKNGRDGSDEAKHEIVWNCREIEGKLSGQRRQAEGQRTEWKSITSHFRTAQEMTGRD